MNTQQYIVNDVAPFPVSTKLAAVQKIFGGFPYSHLPVEEGGNYIGCIAAADAAYLESEKTLADLRYTLAPFYVRDTTNWLDIIEAFALNASNIMPVLTPESTYLGYYELHDVMALFNATPFLSGTGSIIVVQKGVRDYSFSEICQIVEANGSKILGAFVSKIESDMVQVTIKTGHLGMDAIVQTFRRYGYVVVSSHGEDTFLDNLKERSKYLNKYLNI